MSKFIRLIKALALSAKSQKDLDNAYLSESTDVYDLERRMREIDLRGRSSARALSFGPNPL